MMRIYDIMPHSKRITIRNVSPELARRLKALGETRGESINTTVLRLLKQAVGIHERREKLLRYATWTKADAEEFERALAEQRVIDPELWK